MAVPVSTPERRTLTRRQFLQLSALAAGGGLIGYAGLWDRHHLVLTRRTIRIRRLPEAFDGLRIAQISDIHYEEFSEPHFVKEVVRRVNELEADIVVITGDFVTDGPLPRHIGARFSYPCAETLAGLTCPHRIASLGNHDFEVGATTVVDALRLHGIPCLVNSHMPFERSGSRLWLGGTASLIAATPDLDRSLPAKAAPEEPVILLAHEPDFAHEVARLNRVDLMLSGHTHGGQVHLPLLGTPRKMLPQGGRIFVEGHFVVGSMQLYVNRGIGTVKLPIRFLCPPEITLLTLRPA
jgi:predicted MPP superfamily phosphohydrolase